MAISRSRENSDLQKQLKTLSRQLYGKQEGGSSTKSPLYTYKPQSQTTPGKVTSNEPTLSYTTTDTLYLKRDLTKILILSSLVFATEFLLYFGLKMSLIKLPFY